MTYSLISGESLMLLDLTEFDDIVDVYNVFGTTDINIKEYEDRSVS
jgi:hypothetical protein